MRRRVALFVVLVASASAARAQLPGPGVTWSGSSGASAGSYLPSCTPLPVAATAGETITMRVWGDVGSPFALLAASTATGCQPLPGLGNALVLDPPLIPLAAGALMQTSPCLSCPPGYEEIRFVVPAAIPPGLSASFQAVAAGNRRLSFTVAITATVQ